MIQTGAFDCDNVPGERRAMMRDAGMLCVCCDTSPAVDDAATCDDCDDARFEAAPW